MGSMDTNGDGVLSFEEVTNGFTKLSDNTTDISKLQEIFKNIDLDGSKDVDYTEFCAAGLDQKTSLQDDVIWAAFQAFDRDSSGSISVCNLKKILSSADVYEVWSAEVCKEVCAEIVARFDTDGNGVIDFENWRVLMQ